MNKKIYAVLNKIYAVLMFTSFFAGFVPVIPFIVALIVGGDVGAGIYKFLFTDYFPWVIAVGSLSIIVGLVAMYIAKIEDLSLKSLDKKSDDEKKDVGESKDGEEDDDRKKEDAE